MQFPPYGLIPAIAQKLSSGNIGQSSRYQTLQEICSGSSFNLLRALDQQLRRTSCPVRVRVIWLCCHAARLDPPACENETEPSYCWNNQPNVPNRCLRCHAPDHPTPASCEYKLVPANQHQWWRYNAIAPDVRRFSVVPVDKTHFPQHPRTC